MNIGAEFNRSYKQKNSELCQDTKKLQSFTATGWVPFEVITLKNYLND